MEKSGKIGKRDFSQLSNFARYYLSMEMSSGLGSRKGPRTVVCFGIV